MNVPPVQTSVNRVVGLARLRPRAPLEFLARFARAHVASGDIDPVYPVLRHLERGDDDETALRRSLLFVAYYNLASAETASEADADAALRLPTATERRGLRGGAPLARHLASLNDLATRAGSVRAWLLSEGDGWNDVRRAVEQAWGNARWASYKTAEVLQKVNGWPLAATDMGNYGSSGPLRTLRTLYDLPAGESPAAVAAADEAAEDLRERLRRLGVPLGIEQLETVLCDFGSAVKGRYYVGHDIDQMLEQTLHPSCSAAARERIWDARAATLPRDYLGELAGWRGVEPRLGRVYGRAGEIGDRASW